MWQHGKWGQIKLRDRGRFSQNATLLCMETTLEETQESISVLQSKGIIQGKVLAYESLGNARFACFSHPERTSDRYGGLSLVLGRLLGR